MYHLTKINRNKHIRHPCSVTRKLNKILPNVWKKVTQNTEISTSKLNLKAQNIHIKLL
jgi:hypothetical protein